MAQSNSKVTRSVKDILVSHEQRLQQIGELLESGQGNVQSKGTQVSQEVSVKLKNSEELQKKFMINQRTFNNSLQQLNGRTSKLEQLLVELSVDIRNLKKKLETKDNVTLEIVDSKHEETQTEETQTEETQTEETQTVKEEVEEEISKTKQELQEEKRVVIDENKNQEFESA